MIFARFLLFVCLTVASLGCQSSMISRHFTQTVGYRETNSARENPADQTSDPWIQDVGTMTREEHSKQEIVDPLKLRNVFMSEKARDIERNLGFGS